MNPKILSLSLLLLAVSPAFAESRGDKELWKGVAAAEEGKYDKAVEFYERAADKGNTDAMINLALMYDKGKGVPEDNAQALRLYRVAAAGGNMHGYFNEALMHEKGDGVPKNTALAVPLYRKAAELGSPDAMANLSNLLRAGDGTPRDDAGASYWIEKLAETGRADAMRATGYCYWKGCGVTVDKAKAALWYQKAAEKGDATSAYRLGLMYVNGDGVARDLGLARHWLQRGAEQGDKGAEAELAKLPAGAATAPAVLLSGGQKEYDRGMHELNMENNKKTALEWFTKAMEQGHPTAPSFVVDAHLNGYGTPKNVPLARETARKCAEMKAGKENDYCQNILAQLLYQGSGGAVDREAARYWFERAALNGNTLAMFFLAEMYDKGDGIARNDALATYWYKVAYGKGSIKAENVLKARGLIQPSPQAQAFIDHMHKNGPRKSSVGDYMYDAAMYCKFGGPRCHEYTVAAQKFMNDSNAQAESANLQRLWNVYAAPSGADDAAWRAKSECMQKKTESIQRNTYGQQDWKFAGDC
jgi:TPR repeat protein